MPVTYGLHDNMTYSEYITSLVDERILPALQEEMWSYDGDIAVESFGSFGEPTDDEIEARVEKVRNDIYTEVIKQIKALQGDK